MFDGALADFIKRGSDEPLAARTLPWQAVILLLFFLILSGAAAFLYPDVFAAPLEQF